MNLFRGLFQAFLWIALVSLYRMARLHQGRRPRARGARIAARGYVRD